MPIPTQAVSRVGEKTGGALAAMACCTAAPPARLAKSTRESIWRFLLDLPIVPSPPTTFASALYLPRRQIAKHFT